MSLLGLMPCRVTPRDTANLLVPAAYCCRPVMSLLVLLPSRVTPGDLADEFTCPSGVLFSPSHVTPGVLAQSCHSWSSRRRIYRTQRLIAFAQSSQSWISCPVMSLLQLLPSRVTPGVPAGEFPSSRGVLLSPIRVTPGTLAQSCHSCSPCQVASLLEVFLANF